MIVQSVNWVAHRNRLTGFLLFSWCSVVFALSSFPGSSYPKVDFFLADKLVHVCLYSTGGFLAALYFYSRRKYTFTPLGFGMLYAVSDEFHQLFVPQRSFSVGDIIADTVGVLIGLSIFRLCIQYKNYPVNLEPAPVNRMEVT